jgi:hypothetical protein
MSLPTPVGATVIDEATVVPPLSPPALSHRPISASAPTPTGLPLYLISIPPSPSPIPSYALSLMTAPEFTMATSPSPTPSFTAHMPMPPQQHYEDVFYGGVDGIRASMAQLQAAARCLLAHRQGQRPIFKRKRPVVPATLQQLTGRKAIVRASTYKVFVVVWLQARLAS